ncbi:MAG TPA: SDR family oxidoreductase [Phycisphaerales bacterium]|nr:SDR family oxidoreductase [Phycisphaerales bacterium]
MAEPHDALAGQTALVTGAAHRIGRAIALALAERGVNVVVHCRHSTEAAEELADLLRHKGTRAWAVQADLTEPGAVEDLWSQTVRAAGQIDILVNSASIFEPDTLWDCTAEALWYNIRLHAWAPLVLARALAQQAGPAQIVNLLDARLGGYDPKHVSYQSSKQMLFSLTRMLAVELAPRIRVNAVAPGLILPPPGRDEAYLQKLAHTNPLHRHGDTKDVTDAVLYVLGASFVTGQVIYVDGGRHLGKAVHD